MKATKTDITRVTLTELDRLDPVTLIMEDLGDFRGKLTIDCYGKAWTTYWGSMGCNIAEFIASANVSYLVGSLSDINSTVTDYDAISTAINDHCDEDSIHYQFDLLEETFGPDWRFSLPTASNHEYEYLCRIVSAVKEYVEPNNG